MNHPLRGNSMGRILVELLVIAVLPAVSTTTSINTARAAEPLERLPYNHPGLHVDLGVGLWAWPVPCDADGDGDFDLIVSCPDKPSNGVWFFENATGDTAKDKFPVFKPARRLSRAVHYVMPKPAWTWWTPAGKELVTQWRTTPVVYDFNRDGLLDLALLDTEGYFAFFERARRAGRLVLLPPRRVFGDAPGEPLRFNNRAAGGSGRRKLAVLDWDGDGTPDLLLNSANADLYRGLGLRGGQWRFDHLGTLARQNIEGHDVSPTVVDFDGNGISDFLGGAEDGRFYFLKNPRETARSGR